LAREVAQIGAVLGRDFAYPLLRDIAERDEPALQASLDRLAEADLLFVEGAPPQANYRFKHALIQDAAYDSLLKSRRQALHRRAAEIQCSHPERAMAVPEVIAHHFTEAGLDDLAIEWWGKAGDQALRRSAFQEAIAHLGKAIAMADKAGGMSRLGEAVTAQSRPDIRAKFAQALMITEGPTAAATQAALDRADGTSAVQLEETEQLTTFYGRFMRAMISGRYPAALAIAEGGLREGEVSNRKQLVANAHRWIGFAEFNLGSFAAARAHLEHALKLDDQRWAEAQRVAIGYDHLVAVHCLLSLPLAALGEVEAAARHAALGLQRAQELAQPFGVATAYTLDLVRLWLTNRPKDALHVAEASGAIMSAKGIGAWDPHARLHGSWASGRLSDPIAGAKALREAWGQARQRAARTYDANAPIMLADLAVSAGDAEEALRCVAEALEIVAAQSAGNLLAPLHRIRGEALALRDTAQAEEAFQESIRIAGEQGARTFALQAALPLAKLYQSTARPVEAHAVLSNALEGFSPMPEMPEIAEAQALLAALAETDEVRTEIEQRRRRIGLQMSYSQDLMWSKGFAAEETGAAFARVSEFAQPSQDTRARLVAYYAQCLRGIMRGEYCQAREIAEIFLREAEAGGRDTEAGAARRMLGLALLNQGELKTARSTLERALRDSAPQRDGETHFLFDWDTDGEASAAAYLALAGWHLGEVELARQLIQRAIRRAEKLGHVATIANVLFFKTLLESRRNDASATRLAADALLGLAKEHGIKTFAEIGQVYANWAHGRLADREAGAVGLRQALAANIAQGEKGGAPWLHGLLAELEAPTRGPDYALTLIDQGLATAHEIGQRSTEPHLHRLRGEMLLRGNPADPVPAEEAFQTAIAIARQQGARSYELFASLALAKLYQSTSRPADARAALAPALEGFSPTPEMPEVAEAQALLGELSNPSLIG
jgi:tetratricopeptide (TPR) repeat protein